MLIDMGLAVLITVTVIQVILKDFSVLTWPNNEFVGFFKRDIV